MVERDECPALDRNKQARLAALGTASRQREIDELIAELRLKHFDWGQRGSARKIAKKETSDGNPISTRTLQRYFKRAKK